MSTAISSDSEDGSETAWYLQESADVLQAFRSSDTGLDTAEVEQRQAQFGPNELTAEKPLSVPKLLLAQFKNALILILLAATVISAAIGDRVDSLVIAAAVLLCVILGFLFEYRAEKAIKHLKELAAPTAAVIRAGTEENISTDDLVPGDILVLRPGDRVPADARLIESKKLTVDESPLTGESVPVNKDTSALLTEADVNLAERSNMVYSGTTVLEGRGRGVVTATGMHTEFGKIAGMLASEPEMETPLKRRINEIGKWLSTAYVIICAAILAVGVLRGYEFLVMLIWGISLAVAIVPETLPLIITGTLAVGVQRMARKKAIVRKLPAVETLGCITTICADKTGTLTKNEMTVRTLYANGQMIEVTGVGYEPEGEFLDQETGEQLDSATTAALRMVVQIAALCNDSSIRTEYADVKINGAPTEGALVVAAQKMGFKKQDLEQRYPRESEIPFERDRMRMTTIHRDTETGKIIAYVKGAPEALLQLSNCIYRESNGEVKQEQLSTEERNEILTLCDELAARAYRLIGVAYRELREDELEQLTPEAVEQDLIFVGLLGMTDPPREEVKEAIEYCKRAGIVPIMITGDHKLTAMAIAKELGIVPGSLEDDQVLTGAELERLSDEEFERIANTVRVYSRVSPEHKLRIVEVLQRNGAVVAMTGDGINDAPALKRSDAGIAMNSGTDVAKEAADLVLTDNNFATIVAAIHEGRAIYDNVKKYLTYILSYGVAEVCLLAGAFFYGLPFPLIAIQILWANIVIEDLPAMGLGVDPPDPDIMDRPPRDPNERVFTGGMLKMLALMAAVIVIGCLGIFLHYLPRSALPKAQTMVFTTFILYELINAFNCRSARHSLFRVGVFSNRWLILGVFGSLVLLLFAVQLPCIAQFFHSVPLSGREWGLALGTSISIFLVVELYKAVKARVQKREAE
ncbi:MAG: cation-translocating P-type ATPase [Candidatus Methanospirareceae archaeon]